MTRFLYCYNCRTGQMMKRVSKFPSGSEYYRCGNCEHIREYHVLEHEPDQDLPLDKE